MWTRRIVLVALGVCASGGVLSAQNTSRVDFARDVAPIFRQNCVSCHGPSQQIAGLRLDRRSSVFANRRVVPTGPENSLLYHRLIGDPAYGPQMPPTGPIGTDAIETIRAWIAQGAQWPDALANEIELPPPDERAIAIVDALRRGDRQPLMNATPALLNARGPEGSTPLMYAVLYTDAPTVATLLDRGADANAHNDANATALMWAATDLAKSRVLVDHGADVNAQSAVGRTALMIAATRPGNSAVVKLLLERGANPNPTQAPMGQSSPLIQAAMAGDPDMMRLLLDRGADVQASAGAALALAIIVDCAKCQALLTAKDLGADAYTFALLQTASVGDANVVRLLLDHGAEVNATDPQGRTPLMMAAVSDALPVEEVKLLLARGANVNAVDTHTDAGDAGLTAFDLAALHGETPVVAALRAAGAKGTARPVPARTPVSGNTVRGAIARSLPLVQHADAGFIAKAGCFSCHNNSIAAMAVAHARAASIAVDEPLAAQQVRANVQVLSAIREMLHEGFFAPIGDYFAPGVLGYALVGLDAEHHSPDLDTDAVAMYLRAHQMPDGHWPFPADIRPPLCDAFVGQTALAMRGLQLYAPVGDKTGYDDAIRRAGAWLARAKPTNTDDLGWRLVGLTWAGRDRDARNAMRELLAVQRADGGWSDLPSMDSTAYATGKALVALRTAGLPVSDAAYQRGVRFLLDTQEADGSWYVRTRALGFQPYFDNGFPHEHDQWISAAATSWATAALSLAAADGTPPTTTAGGQ